MSDALVRDEHCCKTCHFWDSPREDLGLTGDFGVCHLGCARGGKPDNKNSPIYGTGSDMEYYSYHTGVCTRADFGCFGWRAIQGDIPRGMHDPDEYLKLIMKESR